MNDGFCFKVRIFLGATRSQVSTISTYFSRVVRSTTLFSHFSHSSYVPCIRPTKYLYSNDCVASTLICHFWPSPYIIFAFSKFQFPSSLIFPIIQGTRGHVNGQTKTKRMARVQISLFSSLDP